MDTKFVEGNKVNINLGFFFLLFNGKLAYLASFLEVHFILKRGVKVEHFRK